MGRKGLQSDDSMTQWDCSWIEDPSVFNIGQREAHTFLMYNGGIDPPIAADADPPNSKWEY